MKTNLRGELTSHQANQPEQFSLRHNQLINAVASRLNVGSDEVAIREEGPPMFRFGREYPQ